MARKDPAATRELPDMIFTLMGEFLIRMWEVGNRFDTGNVTVARENGIVYHPCDATGAMSRSSHRASQHPLHQLDDRAIIDNMDTLWHVKHKGLLVIPREIEFVAQQAVLPVLVGKNGPARK